MFVVYLSRQRHHDGVVPSVRGRVHPHQRDLLHGSHLHRADHGRVDRPELVSLWGYFCSTSSGLKLDGLIDLIKLPHYM